MHGQYCASLALRIGIPLIDICAKQSHETLYCYWCGGSSTKMCGPVLASTTSAILHHSIVTDVLMYDLDISSLRLACGVYKGRAGWPCSDLAVVCMAATE